MLMASADGATGKIDDQRAGSAWPIAAQGEKLQRSRQAPSAGSDERPFSVLSPMRSQTSQSPLLMVRHRHDEGSDERPGSAGEHR